MIKYVDMLLRANRSSSFIHHDDFTFIRGVVTEGHYEHHHIMCECGVLVE
jgi:hypothetical protein